MPIVKPVEEELEQILMPRTENAPNPEDRFWVVLDVSPAMGRDLVEVSSRDTAGTTLLKGVVKRLREWNYLQADGTAWPITLENVGKLLDIEEINFLSDKIKTAKAAQQLSEPEKKA
jgi:hypothetical protein